jgi:hypothetical protein
MPLKQHMVIDEDTTDACLDKPIPVYGPDKHSIYPRTAAERKALGLPPPPKRPPLSEG